MTRIGYDSVDVNGIPADATLMFGYINGNPAWRSYAPMKQRFPNAIVGSISVNPNVPAHILDIENGDALPEQAPAWVDLSKAAGFTDPCCYMAMGTWGAVQNAFVGKATPLYWVAHRGSNAMVLGAIANQWLSTAGYDQSIVADYWPGLDPIQPTEDDETMFPEFIRQRQAGQPSYGAVVAHLGGGILEAVDPVLWQIWLNAGRPVSEMDAGPWTVYTQFLAAGQEINIAAIAKATETAIAAVPAT